MDEEEIKLENVTVSGIDKRRPIAGLAMSSISPVTSSVPDPLSVRGGLQKKLAADSLDVSGAGAISGNLDVSPTASAFEKANVIGGAVSGIGGIISGIVGGRARRKEQRAAQDAYNQSLASYKDFEFQNAYTDLENPFEDLRVSTEAAEFQAQQQQQGLAQTLDALRSAGGGAGAAALAQSLSQAQAIQTQRISGDIARQEAGIQQLIAKQTASNQLMEAGGAERLETREFERTGTILGMDQQRKAAADLARQQATQSLVGGIGDLAGAALGAVGMPGGISGLFKSKIT